MQDYQLIGLDDDFLSLMDDNGDTRDDLKCPDNEIGEEIRAATSNEKDILVSFCFLRLFIISISNLLKYLRLRVRILVIFDELIDQENNYLVA